MVVLMSVMTPGCGANVLDVVVDVVVVVRGSVVVVRGTVVVVDVVDVEVVVVLIGGPKARIARTPMS